MGTDPAALALHSTDLGKPFLSAGPSFSISHSGNEVLVAVAPGGRIGIDVEEVRTLMHLLSLARTSFTYGELASVAALPDEARVRAFFRIWTRKEAMLKALGCGLSGLDGIAVSEADMEGNALIRMDDPPELDRWTVRSIAVDPHVEAAVAWDQPLQEVRRISV
jgi:4'-phosphopantetheinyl transferase